MIIDPATFIAISIGSYKTEIGTVEATIGDVTKRVAAMRYHDGSIGSKDFIGRYDSDDAIYAASVVNSASGEIAVFDGQGDELYSKKEKFVTFKD